MNKKELCEKLLERINTSLEYEKEEREKDRLYTSNFFKGRKSAFQEVYLMLLEA